MFGQGFDRTFSYPEGCDTAISSKTVSRLTEKWFHRTPDVVTATPALTDDTAFVGNTFRNTGPTLHFTRAARTKVSNNDFPAGTRLALKAVSGSPSSIEVSEQPVMKVQLQDEYSTATFTDIDNAVFDPDESLYTTVGVTDSALDIRRWA